MSWWGRTAIVASILLGLWTAFKLYSFRVEQQKAKLASLISQRTEELQKQSHQLQVANQEMQVKNTEIMAQKEEIEKQKDTIEESLVLIKRNTQKITSSLNYAQKMQGAFLPSPHKMESILQEYFLIFKPKDIVSGDFYWVNQHKKKIFIVVADCTGHGVPGAFMSILGTNLLTRIIETQEISDPPLILQTLHEEVYEALQQDHNSNKDGMDLGICLLEKDYGGPGVRMTYSGAKSSMCYIHQDQLIVLRGNRKSIGGWQNEEKIFTAQEVMLRPGDLVYMFTDGLMDQANAQRKKLGEKQFFRTLEQFADQEFHYQQKAVEKILEIHQGNTEQRDDITVLGFRV